MKSVAKLASTGLLIAAAVAANALQIDLASHGNYVINGDGTFTSNETVIFQQTDLIVPMLTSMSYTADGTTLVGAGSFTNGTDSLDFSFTFTPDVPTDPFSSTQTAHAIWTYTGGTGAFANMQGSGVMASNYDAPLNQSSLSVFSGRLEAVPEPASMAVLGLGLVGVLRSRRRK